MANVLRKLLTPQELETKRKYDRDYYANRSLEKKNKKYLAQTDRRRKIRFIFEEIKKGKVCCKCGECESVCLDYHHISLDKEFDISSAIGWGYGIEAIYKELDKCIVICSNCHRKLHAGLIA